MPMRQAPRAEQVLGDYGGASAVEPMALLDPGMISKTIGAHLHRISVPNATQASEFGASCYLGLIAAIVVGWTGASRTV